MSPNKRWEYCDPLPVPGFIQSNVPGTAPGTYLMDGSDARNITLAEATMNGGWVPDLETTIYEKTLPVPSAASKHWLMAVIDGQYLKVVETKVTAIGGRLYLQIQKAGYKSGYNGQSVPPAADVNVVSSQLINANIATTSTQSGYGLTRISWAAGPIAAATTTPAAAKAASKGGLGFRNPMD